MPVIKNSTYKGTSWWKNGHLSTITQALFREVEGVHYTRERLELKDGDFLDLDWARNESGKLVVLLHGLEGNSQSGYMKGMAKTMSGQGWDVLSLNFRGCSGEENRKYRSYHSGDTADLQEVLAYVTGKYRYHRVSLIGFSLGGNVLLKYLGENSRSLYPEIFAAAAISAPCDLQGSVEQLSKFSNQIYQVQFLKSLKRKMLHKTTFPEATFTKKDLARISSIQEFDELYTAPVHGFKNAEEYYQKSSSKHYLYGISIPTLLINAQDDPFLSPECYPIEEAFSHPNLHLEMPAKGGHVAFPSEKGNDQPWHETRVFDFFWELGFENEASLTQTA